MVPKLVAFGSMYLEFNGFLLAFGEGEPLSPGIMGAVATCDDVKSTATDTNLSQATNDASWYSVLFDEPVS